MDYKQTQSLTSFVAISAYVAAIVLISGQFNELVPDPYMDEIFHVKQARTYCKGRWLEWDDKITTPPGLYLPIAIFHHVLPYWFTCSINGLRAMNAVLLCILPWLNSRILSHFRKTPYPPYPGVKPRVRFLIPEDDIILEAIVISCFPIAYFSGFLFYTDIASLVSVLACYDQSLTGHHITAGLLGLLSCTFRQTNVIWVAFIAGSALLARFKSIPTTPGEGIKSPTLPPQPKLFNPPLMDSSLLDVPKSLQSLLINVRLDFSAVCLVMLPYLSVMSCFMAFLIWNGGIVLGDKSSHEVIAHVPQIYYFVGFTVLFFTPLVLDRLLFKRSLLRLCQSYSSVLKSTISCVVMIWTVYKFTYEHPFILADNRHYVFYVWRRVFKFHSTVKYALVPGYLFGMRLLWERLARSYTTTLLLMVFYAIALMMTLVPSPLIEPRYFLIPYILLRLHIRPVVEESRTWSIRLIGEGSLYGIVNAFTLGMFLYRPWKSQPGEWEGTWQRFMW